MKKYLVKFLLVLGLFTKLGFALQAMSDKIVRLKNGSSGSKSEVASIIATIKDLEENRPGILNSLIHLGISSNPVCDEHLKILKQLNLINENNQLYRPVWNVLETWIFWTPEDIDKVYSEKKGRVEHIFTLKNGVRIVENAAESIRKRIIELRDYASKDLINKIALEMLLNLCFEEGKNRFNIIINVLSELNIAISDPEVLLNLDIQAVNILRKYDFLNYKNDNPSIDVKNIIKSWVSFRDGDYFFEEDFVLSKEEIGNSNFLCTVS